jgi:hypothetical protein
MANFMPKAVITIKRGRFLVLARLFGPSFPEEFFRVRTKDHKRVACRLGKGKNG